MSLNSPENIFPTGIFLTKDACVVIVRTEWNAPIVNLLENGCTEILRQNNIPFVMLTVPGAVEISFAIKRYWDLHNEKKNHPAAFIALGCVIRGDTPHFDYVCNTVTEGILHLNLHLPVPTIFGVLTVNTEAQADERTTGKLGNKGAEAAVTALKMISLNEKIKLINEAD